MPPTRTAFKVKKDEMTSYADAMENVKADPAIILNNSELLCLGSSSWR